MNSALQYLRYVEDSPLRAICFLATIITFSTLVALKLVFRTRITRLKVRQNRDSDSFALSAAVSRFGSLEQQQRVYLLVLFAALIWKTLRLITLAFVFLSVCLLSYDLVTKWINRDTRSAMDERQSGQNANSLLGPHSSTGGNRNDGQVVSRGPQAPANNGRVTTYPRKTANELGTSKLERDEIVQESSNANSDGKDVGEFIKYLYRLASQSSTNDTGAKFVSLLVFKGELERSSGRRIAAREFFSTALPLCEDQHVRARIQDDLDSLQMGADR